MTDLDAFTPVAWVRTIGYLYPRPIFQRVLRATFPRYRGGIALTPQTEERCLVEYLIANEAWNRRVEVGVFLP